MLGTETVYKVVECRFFRKSFYVSRNEEISVNYANISNKYF